MTEKYQSELTFWKGMVTSLTSMCSTENEKSMALLRVCYDVAFPRYMESLYLSPDSFRSKTVLDLGCGPHGGLIGFLDCVKYGVDPLIEEYKRIGYPLDQHGVNYRLGYAEAIPLDNSTFDNVLCVNALDHIDDLNNGVKEIARILRPGGSLLGQLNFHRHPTVCHPICLSEETLSSLFEKYGMTIVSKRYQYHLDTEDEDRYFYKVVKSKGTMI